MAMSKKTQKQIREDEFITNKVLAVFAVCLIGILWIMLLGRLFNYSGTITLGFTLQKVSIIIGGIGILWGLFLFAREKSGKRNAKGRIFCGKYLIILSLCFTLAMTAIGIYGMRSMKPLYVLLPALAVYYLIFHSYAPEFFLIATDCGLAFLMIALSQRALVTQNFAFVAYIALAAMAVFALMQIALTTKMNKNGGVFAFGKQRKDMKLSENAYKMLIITPIIMAIIVILSFFLPAYTTIFYGITAVYLFITAVYYTVKMM